MPETKLKELNEAAAILQDVLRVLREAGSQVGVKVSPAKDERPAGIIIFAGGITRDDDGVLRAVQP